MIKKLLLIIIMSIFTLVLFNQSVYASAIFIDEPAANTGGLWHVEDGNRVYVNMRYTYGETVIETGTSSNETHPEYDLSLYTKWWGASGDLSFPSTSLYDDYVSISNPDETIYDRFVVKLIPHIEAPASDGIPITIYDNAADQIAVQLYNHEDRPVSSFYDDWSYFTLSVDGDEVLSSRNYDESDAAEYGGTANPNGDDLYFGVNMYWEKSELAGEIDPGDSNIVNPWSALPGTTGSPENPTGDWGTVSDMSVSNNNISFNINYLGTIYPVSSFSVSGDLDFISKSNDVLYYSDPNSGDRILYFNFGETLDSAILAARTFSDVSVWKGEALWNLTENEIKVTDVLTVYNYIPEVDEDGNVYSYFYMPDVPFDSLISVSAVLGYRYWSDGLFGIGPLEPGEIQYKNVAAVRGETSSVNPTWVESAYTTSYIVGGLAVVGTLSGVAAPIYGWPISAACFITAGVLTAADINEWFAYDVNQIEHVIPSISLTSEINTYISESSGDDQFTADTDKLYKLHLATLQDYDDVQIMGDLSNITQVVWETDGEIYVLEEETILDADWSGPGTLIPQDDIGNDDLQMIMYIGIGVVGVVLFIKLKLDKKPGLLVLIVGATVYILYTMGIIEW